MRKLELLERQTVKSPIKALDGWVVVKQIEVDEVKTKSGLVLQNSGKEKEECRNIGVVLDVPKESPVAVGCTVYYKNYAGQEAYVDSEKYLIIEMQDLCGVLKD